MAEIRITPGFRSALHAVRDGRHVFVTGRAGTGKSTLLSLIRQQELARACAVVAPTGVAALNVAGETIHSFFAFRPSLSPDLREYRAPAHLEGLELLIVDEVSMARADLIDMMDTALRRRRRSDVPFGGVQVVLVGDLYQLPPVVNEVDEAVALRDYPSPFFFAAKALRDFPCTNIELEDVFRQRDNRFIALLNAIRDGTATDADLEELNTRCDPEQAERPGPGTITLTTTNRTADAVNRARLEQLSTPVFTSTATTSGEFDASQYKAEERLSFAVGAQVMMLVNSSEYVNGSLGRIVDVAPDAANPSVAVELRESGETVEVRPHRWEITRTVRRDGRVAREVVGSFRQLPFRLAWAVTVHKSQGKTFDEVVFDRGRSVFAAGQLYVALSRCTSLQGLTLKRPLRHQDVITDADVKRFHAKAITTPVRQADTLRSYVGYVSTGGGEYDKLVEFAVVRELPKGGRVSFTTLVNPLRDMSDAREAGIVASDVAIAPTVEELRRPLAALLSGTVLVAHQVTALSGMIDWEQDGHSEGVGIDLRDHGIGYERDLRASALDRARAVGRAADEISADTLPTTPLRPESAQPPAGVYILPRQGHPDLTAMIAFITELSLSAEARLRLLMSLAPGAADATETLVGHAHAFALQHRLPDTAVGTIARKLVDRLTSAAKRNDTFTPAETAVIQEVADAFAVPFDGSALVTGSVQVELGPGTRVCLTGSPPSGSDHAHLSKQHLRAAASQAGLVETSSVTKSKCDLVVAFDPSSMSGKAKKARELGKPIVGAAEFLALLEQRRPTP